MKLFKVRRSGTSTYVAAESIVSAITVWSEHVNANRFPYGDPIEPDEIEIVHPEILVEGEGE